LHFRKNIDTGGENNGQVIGSGMEGNESAVGGKSQDHDADYESF
jgi:hypothetical protein